MFNKKILTILGIVITAVLAVAVAGVIIWQNYSLFKEEIMVVEKVVEDAGEDADEDADKDADRVEDVEEDITEDAEGDIEEESEIEIVTASWKTYRNDKYGIEFKYSDKYTTFSSGPNADQKAMNSGGKVGGGYQPSHETVVFDDKRNINSEMSIFWEYDKEISEKNYEEDYMLFKSGLCDKDWRFVQESIKMDYFGNIKTLVVTGERSGLPLNCYYFKNKDNRLIVFSIYYYKIQQVIRNLNFFDETVKIEGLYNDYYPSYHSCLAGWAVSGGGQVSCAYTSFAGSIVNWAKMTKTGAREVYPVTLYQAITTPSDIFEVSFDYIFVTKTGTLYLTLNSVVLVEISASRVTTGLPSNFKVTVPHDWLFNVKDAVLIFNFSGPENSEVLITNVNVHSKWIEE